MKKPRIVYCVLRSQTANHYAMRLTQSLSKGATYHSAIILLLMLFLFASCARASQQQTQTTDDNGIDIALEFSPDPATVGESKLKITITDAAGAPIEGVSLAVKGDMTHAGMTPVFTNINEDVAGVYTTPFEWTMGGDWIVTVVATFPDGHSITRRFDLNVGGDMDMNMQ